MMSQLNCLSACSENNQPGLSISVNLFYSTNHLIFEQKQLTSLININLDITDKQTDKSTLGNRCDKIRCLGETTI